MMDSASKIDPRALRKVMGSFATGITVVTTAIGKNLYGCTVNSFTSVSLDPPLVLFCLHNDSGLKQAILESQNFVVNILAADQEHISNQFANYKMPVDQRFEGVEYSISGSWSPIIKNTLAYLDCTIHTSYAGGDHTIMIGKVEMMGVESSAAPLIYFEGKYRKVRNF